MGSTLTKASRRESAQRDADRERRLRADSETRAKQALQETARCRSRLKLLTNEFSRMEETVRSMLVYKKQVEQLKQEKNALTLAFENRCQQYQGTINRLNNEISALRQQLAQVGEEAATEELFQAHADALQRNAEESRKQYERCLDDVANQVVKALLAQKGLKEEVGTLNSRIHELESQNRALTSMLVHQLRGSETATSTTTSTTTTIAANTTTTTNTTADTTTTALSLVEQSVQPQEHSTHSSSGDCCLNLKHCSSFNSEIQLEEHLYNIPIQVKESVEIATFEKRLSATSEIIDSRLSLDDKKRHQILSKLWSDLKGTEVTAKKILEIPSVVESALWMPPKRPVSLNLHLPAAVIGTTKIRRTKPIMASSTHQVSLKSEEEATTGNESPESGNRDEGYSTMSSDVQTEVTRSTGEPLPQTRGLEDLAEDETEFASTTETRLLVADNKDPDILYIPFNLLNVKPRNSFPPSKDFLPFQHIMRSFSDSHLCLKITTAPSPCYSFSTPISSSPSIFLLDLTEKNPLRRTKATGALYNSCGVQGVIDKSDQSTWSSPGEERIECTTTWDAEYIQQWLRLDETRLSLQQQQHHRDLFELEYDRAELEDWSLNLSSEDLREQFKRMEALTPGQISISTLPSIQENNVLELEEDANECLWNNSSYMMDKEGQEIMTLLMDDASDEKNWPYANTAQNPTSPTINHEIIPNSQQNLLLEQQHQLEPQESSSPANSWSSDASDCYHHNHDSHPNEDTTCSKRSSVALSGCSDDTGELPIIVAAGTDFTRDFYRLVKFESTKSLASTSSKSAAGGENGVYDHRDTALQNVLTFIAEQQKYIGTVPPQALSTLHNHQHHYHHHNQQQQQQQQIPATRPCSENDVTKEFNIEGGSPQLQNELMKLADSDLCLSENVQNTLTMTTVHDDTNYVTLKQLCDEYNNTLNEKRIAYANEVCLVTPLDVAEECESCINITERPVEISAVCVEQIIEQNTKKEEDNDQQKIENTSSTTITTNTTNTSTNNKTSPTVIKTESKVEASPNEDVNTSSSSMNTSSVSTPDTVVSRIPRRRQLKLPDSPAKRNDDSSILETRIPKSKLLRKKTAAAGAASPNIVSTSKESIVMVHQKQPEMHVITSERLPQCTSGVISNIIDGPPHRAISFHERATSKDVIDELNRMIKNGDETQPQVVQCEAQQNLDQGCCKPTGWIHVERDIDLADPKARANLLDVMMASVSSDSSPTSSCGGSVASDSTEEPPNYGQLHRIHRFHRQKKANAVRPELAVVVRGSTAPLRPTIIDRPDFYVRYGEKEKEAVASFDFLDEFSSTSSGCSPKEEEKAVAIQDAFREDSASVRSSLHLIHAISVPSTTALKVTQV